MKANKPSLILYFLALFAIVIFDLFDRAFLVVFAKSIIVPSMFFYYLVSSNYKIRKEEGIIFLFCFIGQVFDLMAIEISEVGSMGSFIIVYLVLLKMILADSKKIRIRKIDLFPIFIVVFFIVYLLVSTLNIQFDKMNQFRLEYVIYGIISCVLGCVSFISYITRDTNMTFLFASIMSCCFIASDVFYVFDQYFPGSSILTSIKDICQVLSYYFMVQYFINRDNKTLLSNPII